MGYTRLSVLLAHLVLCFTRAESAVSAADGQLSTAQRFGFRSGEPLTRRGPDTRFTRFGRSGDGGGGGDDDGVGNGGVAPKKKVKREAYGLAAVDASVSPAPSLTCVPDADTDGRVVCYSPVNVSRHFLLVTDRDREDDDGDGAEDEPQRRRRRRQPDEKERSDDDSEGGLEASVDDADDGTADEGPIGRADSGALNRTARRSRRRDSGKGRFGRSTAADADGADAFPRYGRRRDNFMRLGRAGVNRNESPLGELRDGANSEAKYAAISTSDKRGSRSFLRFGRERSRMARQSLSGSRRRDSWPRPSTDEAESADSGPLSSESAARQRDAFARLGRHGPGDMNQLRFGRGSSDRMARRHGNSARPGRDVAGAGDRTDRLFGRATRRRDNFMRLGRSGGDFDLDMFRETRRRDSFLRLGRGGGGGGGPVVDGGGDGNDDDVDDDDVYRIAMAAAALDSRIKA